MRKLRHRGVKKLTQVDVYPSGEFGIHAIRSALRPAYLCVLCSLVLHGLHTEWTTKCTRAVPSNRTFCGHGMFYICTVQSAAATHTRLLSTWNVAGMIEEVSVYLLTSVNSSSHM